MQTIEPQFGYNIIVFSYTLEIQVLVFKVCNPVTEMPSYEEKLVFY